MTDGRAPRTRRWSPVWALLLLVALAVTTAGIFPLRQILAQQDQVEATRAVDLWSTATSPCLKGWASHIQ